MSFDNRQVVLIERLGAGLDYGTPPHLLLLHPNHSDRCNAVLSNLKHIASDLQNDPIQWRQLIRDNNWRCTLVGCSAALVIKYDQLYKDMVDRFLSRSWIAPQLAVALGLMHELKAVPEFERILSEDGQRVWATAPKITFSAYAVLKKLGHSAADKFSESNRYHRSVGSGPCANPSEYQTESICNMVESFWDFWAGWNPNE